MARVAMATIRMSDYLQEIAIAGAITWCNDEFCNRGGISCAQVYCSLACQYQRLRPKSSKLPCAAWRKIKL
jgi:hypothetical protein